MKRTLLICAAGVCLMCAAAFGEESRTPAEWVTRLGADHLAERDEASAALLNLGWKARDEVRKATDSPDPEVQFRAQELWKTLRWMVMPDADADIRVLIDASGQNKADREQWRDFVKKHGAESLRLVAEFYANKTPGFENGVYAILEDANPQEVAQVIARAGDAREALEKPIEELTPDRAAAITATNLMQIEIALWHYRKAFDFGRDTWLRLGAPEVEKQCAVALDRGNLFDQVNEDALKDIASEKNAARAYKKLGFYIAIYGASGKQDRIAALCDAAPGFDTAQLHGVALQQLVESFLKAGMPAYAIKALRQPQNPLEMYLRSMAQLRMHNPEAAAEDWKAVTSVLEPTSKATKAQLFSLGELMRKWNDQRCGQIFQKILEITPPEPVYDANAYFRLGEIAEEAQQYRRAADLMEKGLTQAKGTGGVILVTGGKGEVKSGEESVQEAIKRLRALADGQKPVPEETPAPEKKPAPEEKSGPVNDPQPAVEDQAK